MNYGVSKPKSQIENDLIKKRNEKFLSVFDFVTTMFGWLEMITVTILLISKKRKAAVPFKGTELT